MGFWIWILLWPAGDEDLITGGRQSTDSPWHKAYLLKLSLMMNWDSISNEREYTRCCDLLSI